MKVLVRGAGVAGLVLAWELTRRGAAVTVVEKREHIAGNASWQAGGMLAPWCERESAEELVVALGREALDWWPRHHDTVACCGSLVLATRRDEPDLERFARRTTNHRRIDADGIGELEPDLAGRFGRGLYFAEEAHLDPRAALASLAWAPASPDSVTVSGAVTPNTTLRWAAGREADIAGYRVYWRRPAAAQWEHSRWVGNVTEATLAGVIMDNHFFGVAAVDRDGHESRPVFPQPGQ